MERRKILGSSGAGSLSVLFGVEGLLGEILANIEGEGKLLFSGKTP